MMPFVFNRFTFLLIVSLILGACSGTTPTQTETLPTTVEAVEQAIIEAEALEPEARNSRMIKLAGQLAALGEIQGATTLLDRIYLQPLNDEQYLDYTFVAADLYTANQLIFEAYELLTSERLLQLWDQIPLPEQASLYRYRAYVFSQFGDVEASVTERIALGSLLTDPLDITENHDILWQELSNLSLDSLTTLVQITTDEVTKGWYQLAVISKTYAANLEVQQREIASWTLSNPTHPASMELPLDLQLLATLIEQRPQKVALLLPMQGDLATAGKTIRDGFFVAYYNQQKDYKPEVLLYDTSHEPINTLYDKAVAAGADLIIGPLAKDKVATLQAREPLPVATLALNYIGSQLPGDALEEPVVPGSSALYQFGLSLEDEALQAADRAWLEGHRYAMVIASSADWSRRAADTFIQRWQQQGGKVVINRRFDRDSNYSNTIKSAFAIDKSESRARGLKRLFGKNFEFEPRRRQDIDMIFLVARSSEGQQIKPTLAFHYASNIPVYATSQIYSSAQTKGKNRDLNGIRFTTLPWTLDPDSIEKSLISEYSTIPPNYERLYALGVDSFLLYDRLQQLARSPAATIYGKTGKLRLDSRQRIVREQPWAEIVKGEAKPLPYLTKETTEF